MSSKSFTITVPGFTDPLVIHGEPANINYFLQPDLVPDTTLGFSIQTRQVPTHTRRQYPGDNTQASVNAHTRKVLVDLDKQRRSTKPGRTFTLVEDSDSITAEKRQFTFQGTIAALHTYLAANAQMDLILYSNKGKPYYIPAAGSNS